MEPGPGKSLVMEAEIIEALRTCFDPEIPVNIYELGLNLRRPGGIRRRRENHHDVDLA